MSTTFTLPEDIHEDHCVAFRFWGGDLNGQTVRFAFPELLFSHLKDAVLVGSDGSTETVGELFDKAETVDFLDRDISPLDHISHGSIAARERWGDRSLVQDS